MIFVNFNSILFVYVVKYKKVIIILNVVDKFPPAAIMYGSFPTKAYTKTIDSTQFKNCSNTCVTLVGFYFAVQRNTPLNTADIATNTIAGASTLSTYATSGNIQYVRRNKICSKKQSYREK